MRSDLPSGTVTFLFTDVEGSTTLLHELGAEGYAEALAEHRRVIREACASEGGVEVDTQGDAFFFAFATAPGALAAASAFTDALASGPIQVRVGVHTGTPLLTEEGYVGDDVHRAARIAACGHGGQVLVSSSTAQLVETELADLGEHRFKDLAAPERVYQLGGGVFPPLKSLYRTNLPVPATPFLGRERELADVVGLLDSTRLLTLTGPGGTGKTRLAAQAASLASDSYPDGVWWIPLAPLRDPSLVLETAAQAVGSKDGLTEHVADKAMLCLFDNFEQVVEAAPELATLLAACPNLDLLVTSREPLHVTGEQEYSVPPLAHEEGVGFFLARARAVRPDFQVDEAVSEICARLDDLPLALELAAARVKALTPKQILERLEQRLPLLTGGTRDAPERQRTLRATIEWSYDLLTNLEQLFFARLAVFRGGCTLEAAEEVTEADLDTLQSLVDKSLLRHSNERYWMLETIREYASERLEDSGEGEPLRDRHAEHFFALAEEAFPHLTGNPKEWLDQLEVEHDNLRATLDRLEAAGHASLLLRLAGALWKFWSLRGHVPEGNQRVRTALEVDPTPTASRVRALNGATAFSLDLEDLATAEVRAEEALRISRSLDDEWDVVNSQYLLGVVFAEQGKHLQAQKIFEESVEGFRRLGDDHYTLIALRALAWMCSEFGDEARARSLREAYLELARATGNQRMVALGVRAAAGVATEEGRIEEALSLAREAYEANREVGDSREVANDLRQFAETLAAAGKGDAAARVLSAAEALVEAIGGGFESWVVDWNETIIASIQAQLGEAAFAKAWEKGRTLTPDEAIALALDMELDA